MKNILCNSQYSGKRAFDIFFSTVAIIFLCIPWALLCILVSLGSPGGAFYLSDRVGLGGRVFRMPKFRTMFLQAPLVETARLDSPENWITPDGKYLRKLSIDETPQFLTVLSGEMSIVGPRPALPSQEWLIQRRWERGIYGLKPGITGLAQVRGRDLLSDRHKIRYEAFYLRNHSFRLDLYILFLTCANIWTHRGQVAH